MAEGEHDPLFFRLFYRERLGRLVQLLEGHDFYAAHPNPEIRKLALSPSQIRAELESFAVEAEDDSLCHNTCKGMYFCGLPKGHEGSHRDGPLGW